MLRKVRSLPSHVLPLPNPTCWISLYHLTPSLMVQLISLFLFIMYQPLCTFHILLDPWKENLKVNLPKKTSKDTYQEPVGYSTQFHCFSIHIRSAMGLPCSSVPKHILITAPEGEQGGHRRAPHLTLMPQGPAPGRAGGALHTLGPQLGAMSLHTPSKSSGVFIFCVTNANLLLNYISVRSSLSPNRNYYLCRWGQHWQGSRNLCLK